MKISSFLIGIVMFTVIVLSGSSLLVISQLANPDFMDLGEYESFNNVFNQQQKINETMGNLVSGLQVKNPSLFDSLTLIYNTAVFTVQSVWFGIQFVFTMVTNIPTVLGFSAELAPFIWGIISIITIGLVLSIISATLYREL